MSSWRVMVVSGLVAMASVSAGAEAPEGSPSGREAAEERLLSINFQNTDIDAVLRFFSEATGQIFVKSDGVQGNVTLISPRRIPAKDALTILESVLETKGVALVRSGRVMKVVTMAEAAGKDVETRLTVGAGGAEDGDRVVTQLIPIRYLQAGELKTELQPLVSKSGTLVVDEKTNTLIVTDAASSIRRLIRIVEGLDMRTPQVLIEALIAEVALTKETRLGVQWGRTGVAVGNGVTIGTEQNLKLPEFISEGFRFSIFNGDGGFSGVLNALASDEHVSVLATPRILTANNKEAVIRVGEEVPFLKEQRFLVAGESVRGVEFRTVAIELAVTPRVTANREVALSINPLVRKILSFDKQLLVPIVATREAKSQVVVGDGQTLLLGGLIRDNETKTRVGIPLLKDIPVLGYLFGKTSIQHEKSELLIFVTPHIVTTAEEGTRLTPAPPKKL